MSAIGWATTAAVAALAGLAAAAPANAQVSLEPIGSATYTAPTYVTSPPGEPDRLIVTEQDGMVLQTTPSGTVPFLDLTDKTNLNGEAGLWSIAFAPDFAQSRLFYAAYTAADHAPQVVEYREGATPEATEATERRVLKVEDNPGTSNHNGGQLQFGPDGYLYWSVGDDADAGLAPDLNSLRGKLLRIDPRGAEAGQYTVPPDNPYAGATPGRDEIWSIGLRNPWRFSFDRLTGALTIGDVGAGAREEVNHVTPPAGGRAANFGWPACEGRIDSECSNPAFTAPVYDYSNPPAGPAAVAGGYVVRDPDLSGLYGRYLFADSYAGDLRSIDPNVSTPTDAHRTEPLLVDGVYSFGEDSCGRVYVVSAGDGQIYRLEGPAGGTCPPAVPPPPDPPPADTDPPQTSLKLERRGPRSRRVTFVLSSDEPGSTFRCRLDKGEWRRCAERRKLRGLGTGKHRFRAIAIDAAGNRDPKPAKQVFTVKPRRRG